MKRSEFQAVSRIRLKESTTLMKAGQHAGAYYLAGYAVECALKACIAKQTRRYDFPNKELANKAWVHDLEKLVELAGLKAKLDQDKKANKALELNWAVVKDWSESARYEVCINSAQARDFYSACTARKHGILSWIKKRW